MDNRIKPGPGNTWVYFSLYCCQENWTVLLDRSISPFLNKWKSKDDVRAWQLQLNYDGGANIRLSLLTSQSEAATIATDADKWFNRFFLDAGFAARPVVLPIDAIFLPFPSNSIQFGLYRYEATEGEYHYEMEHLLSEIILQVFMVDNVEDDAVLVLSYYLVLSLLKVSVGTGLVSKNEVLSGQERNAASVRPYLLAEEMLEEKFEMSRNILEGIMQEVLDPEEKNNTPVWLRHWVKTCEGALANWLKKIGEKPQHVISFYDQCWGLIGKHTGLNSNMKLLLHYFIKQSALQINRENIPSHDH